MISSGMHDSLNNPPDIPAFHSTPKRSRESMSSAITGAAKALASALEGTPKASPTDLSCTHTATGVSPSKAVDLRMKNYEQLCHLHQLLDDGILSREEYMEQKQNILCSFRKYVVIVDVCVYVLLMYLTNIVYTWVRYPSSTVSSCYCCKTSK